MTQKFQRTGSISGNSVMQGDGFYISYLPAGGMSMFGFWDSDGSGDETALVKDEKFLILNGDYRDEYEALVDKGYDECLKFYEKNSHKASSWSSK